MATLLARVGRAGAQHRLTVIGAWVLLLALCVAGVGASGANTDDTFTIPGTESQQSLDTLAERFPAASGTTAQLVFVAPDGATVTAGTVRAAIGAVVQAAADAPGVTGVLDPATAGTVSADGRVALAQVQYGVRLSQITDADVTALEDAVRQAAGGAVTVEIGGGIYAANAVEVGATELVGVGIALVVLLVTFGSVLAAGMTVGVALLGVAIGLLGLMSLTDLITISSTAPTLALMIGLAVGIDYSLFLLSRHRSQLAEGEDVRDSIAHATGTAGSAVVFAGVTVVIAMAGLAVVRIPFLTVMGLAASLTVTVAVLIAITLLPALLSLAGERLRPRPGSRTARLIAAQDGAGRPPFARRWAERVTRRPVVTLVVGLALLGTLALPARELALALPDNGSAAPATSERAAYDTLSDAFGPGFNGPLLVVLDAAGTGLSGDDLTAAAVAVRERIAGRDGVAVVSAPTLNPDGDLALLQVVPTTGPTDEATGDLVRTLRDDAGDLTAGSDLTLTVTGQTAADIDISQRLGDALLPFAAVVVGLALILLLLVFRSVLVPIKAAVGFLLSVAAAFGTVVAVFQWGWLDDVFAVHTTGPVVSFLPIIVIAVLFGLAMDYEVFLVSRVREAYVHGAAPRDAVLDGFRHAGRVVTAAALIMFAVFASFSAGESTVVKPMALALAVGVLVDAFVVRMTLVPAVLALLGRAAWWLPRRLDRVLPRVDVEGESLTGPRVSIGPAGGGHPATGTVDTVADEQPVSG